MTGKQQTVDETIEWYGTLLLARAKGPSAMALTATFASAAGLGPHMQIAGIGMIEYMAEELAAATGRSKDKVIDDTYAKMKREAAGFNLSDLFNAGEGV